MRVVRQLQIVTILVVGLGWVLIPSTAQAQPEEPLRLVYINMGGSTGADSYGTIRQLLEESPQIELVESDVFLNIAADFDLSRNIFRRYNRGEYEDELASLMWRTRMEGILVHDMRDRGGRVSIAVIGPRGWELQEVERGLVSETLEMDEAIELLQDIFGVLVPEVRGFRRDVEEGTLSAADFEMPDDVEPDPEFDAPDEDRDRRADDDDEDDDWLSDTEERAPGTVERGASIRIGAMVGQRSLTMDQGDVGDFNLNHSTSLMGPAGRVEGVFLTLEEDTVGIGGAVFLGMSPFRTVFDAEELSGQFLRIGGELRYIDARVEENLLLRGIVGAETTSITLAENQFYTGHGYMNIRIGGGVEYTIDETVVLKADLLLLPVLSASNSGGAYGEASGWLGAAAELGATLDMLDPFLVGLDYNLQFIDVTYAEPVELEIGANSTDFIHQIMIGAGYRF